MTRLGLVAALWFGFAFVTWNVMFDRYVVASAVEFTREQVVRYHNGQPVVSIHDGFSPRVADAAVHASVWVVPIALGGIGAVVLTFRRVR